MYILKKLIRLHWAVMMIKDWKPLIQLQHIHIDTNTEKACKTKLVKYKKWLVLMITLIKI